MGQLAPIEVKVILPRFKFSFGLNLADVLYALGMRLAFTWPGADFSGMTETDELYMSAVLHQAFISLDEKGTEAAASTAILMLLGAAEPEEKPEPKIFRADHPFLFAIRHRRTGAILFLGRFSRPEP